MYAAYTCVMTRTSNLLGALAVAVHDRIGSETAVAAGHGAMVPSALVTLHHSPGIRIGELARILALTHPGTVRLVDRLVVDGLVRRQGDADGRAVTLRLEPKGRRAAQRVLEARAGVLDVALAGLRSDETHRLEPLLERLLAALTPDVDTADHICRLCDEQVCINARCPVEAAIADSR
jgi:MarR family transcriptional regulator, negative regulator of the multidrug operon emrRAB